MIQSLLSDPSDRPDVIFKHSGPPVETNISALRKTRLRCLSNGRILGKELQPLVCKVSGSPGKAHQKRPSSQVLLFFVEPTVKMTVSL